MQATRNTYLPDVGPSFWVSLRYFSLTRVIVAMTLLAAIALSGGEFGLGANDSALFLRTAIAYFVLAALFLYLAGTRTERFYVHLGSQLLLDLVAITSLVHASGGLRAGITVLYLFPVAGAAILAPLLPSVGFAAACTLAILGEAAVRSLEGDPTSAGSSVTAGLYGTAILALAVVINRLAARVIAQQEIAAKRGADLMRQIEINRLVVADMQDGVVVLNRAGHPTALNPSAARMLRVADPEGLVRNGWSGHVAGEQLQAQFNAWLGESGALAETFDLEVGESNPDDDGVGVDRLRGRFVSGSPERFDGGYVLFLEDLQRVDERAQQLKLASMGRLTASIAHEIRNPLAAISHASALLSEDAAPDDRRLLDIIIDNARRLDRIVENILQLSRRGPVQTEELELESFINEVKGEFCRDHACPLDVVDVSVYGRPLLYFNRDHLRQVLLNLLQNARRHASGKPASISVIAVPVVPADGRPARGVRNVSAHQHEIERIELIVQDDGRGIDAETRRHLFEPFFTTHHKGTGLGLYLARELCLANGATLGYVPNADVSKKGGFVINAAGSMELTLADTAH